MSQIARLKIGSYGIGLDNFLGGVEANQWGIKFWLYVSSAVFFSFLTCYLSSCKLD